MKQYQTAKLEFFPVKCKDILTESDLYEYGGYIDGSTNNNYNPEIWGAPNFE